jgi:hypothetical protein
MRWLEYHADDDAIPLRRRSRQCGKKQGGEDDNRAARGRAEHRIHSRM